MSRYKLPLLGTGVLVISILALFMAAGCSSPPPVAAPTATVPKPIVLKFSDFCTPDMTIGRVLREFADKIERDSGGRLVLDLYYGQSIASMQDNFKAVQCGIADMGSYNISSSPGAQELSRVTQLPFLGFTSYEQANWVFEQLWNEFPEIRAEWPGLVVLGVRHEPAVQFHFTEKVVRAPQDMNGMSIVSMPAWADFINSVGAISINVDVGDWYETVARGIAQGLPTHFTANYSMGLSDLFKYHTVFAGIGCETNPEVYLINLNTWNKLTPDLQQVIEDAIAWRVREITRLDRETDQLGIAYAKAKGDVFTYITPEELQAWNEAAEKPIRYGWIAKYAGRGRTQAIYDETLRLIDQYPD